MRQLPRHHRTDVVLHQPPPTNPPQALRDLVRWWRDVGQDPDAPLVEELRPAATFRTLTVLGRHFQAGATVFVGDSTTPWPEVRRRDAHHLKLAGGAALASQFAVGARTRVRVVNPGGKSAQAEVVRAALAD